jgi:hypothetical protein
MALKMGARALPMPYNPYRDPRPGPDLGVAVLTKDHAFENNGIPFQ